MAAVSCLRPLSRPRQHSLILTPACPIGEKHHHGNQSKVIVHIATSADGYIARPDGDLEWLTSRPAPDGFYGMNAFMRSVDTKILGKRTYEASVRLGAKFGGKDATIVFSRQAAPDDAPKGVRFVSAPIGVVLAGLRDQPGKDIWLMGGGDLDRVVSRRTGDR